jgi:hypothetical protein
MGRRTTLAAAALATAALVIPVTLVIAGNVEGVGGDVSNQTVRWTNHSHNASKSWKQVPDVGFLGDGDDAHSVTVSAEMATGRAKFRVRSNGATTPPGAITFSSKASNSFTFGYADGCYLHPSNSLQWKRVGKHKATATKISVLDLNSGDPCF